MKDYYIIRDIADGIEGLDLDTGTWYDSIEDVKKAFDRGVKIIESKSYCKVLEKSKFSFKYENCEYGDPILYHWIIIKISQVK